MQTKFNLLFCKDVKSKFKVSLFLLSPFYDIQILLQYISIYRTLIFFATLKVITTCKFENI